MNRTAAQNATQEINEMERRNFEGRNLPPSTVADIIERACGVDIDRQLKALKHYHAAKLSHPTYRSCSCEMAVIIKDIERACGQDGTCPECGSEKRRRWNVVNCTCPKASKKNPDPRHLATCYCQNKWHSEAEERPCGETACPHCQCTCFQCRNCALPSPPTGRTEEK